MSVNSTFSDYSLFVCKSQKSFNDCSAFLRYLPSITGILESGYFNACP